MGKKSAVVPIREWRQRFEKELTRYRDETIDKIWRSTAILNDCATLIYFYLDTRRTKSFYSTRKQSGESRRKDLEAAVRGFEAAFRQAAALNLERDAMLLSDLHLKYSHLLARMPRLMDTQRYGKQRSLLFLYRCVQMLRLHLRMHKIKPKTVASILKAGYAAMGWRPGKNVSSDSISVALKRFAERNPEICRLSWQQWALLRAIKYIKSPDFLAQLPKIKTT